MIGTCRSSWSVAISQFFFKRNRNIPKISSFSPFLPFIWSQPLSSCISTYLDLLHPIHLRPNFLRLPSSLLPSTYIPITKFYCLCLFPKLLQSILSFCLLLKLFLYWVCPISIRTNFLWPMGSDEGQSLWEIHKLRDFWLSYLRVFGVCRLFLKWKCV